MRISVILVAAGSGKRFGSSPGKPKQLQSLSGKPLLFWPLKTFEKVPQVYEIILVLSKDFIAWGHRFIKREKFKKPVRIVLGGKERSDSVYNGFQVVSSSSKVVLIHDAARVGVTSDIVKRVAADSFQWGASLAAWPVPDTIKSSQVRQNQGFVKKTIARQGLWLAQTPQGFRRDIAKKLFSIKRKYLTDDVQLAEEMGIPVRLSLGSPQNLKITLPEDLKMYKSLIQGPKRGKK